MQREKKTGESWENFYNRSLKHIGIVPEKALSAWRNSTSTHDLPPDKFRYSPDGAVAYNFASLRALEGQKKGSGRILAEEFNLYDIARYPHAVLLDMVAKKDAVTMPYVTAVFARSDWNTAYYEEKRILKNLHSELGNLESKMGKGYALRIVEAEGKKELLHVLDKLQGKYGK